MARYHIKNDGTPGVCHAEKGKCPLGGVSGSENHFDTQAEAQAAADEQHLEKFTNKDNKHTLMKQVNWKEYKPRTDFDGNQRMAIDEDLVGLNEKYTQGNLHIVGNLDKMRAYMNTTNEIGSAMNKRDIIHSLKKYPNVYKEYKNTPHVSSLENTSFDKYASAVQDWTYAKMNYERDGNIETNPMLDRVHYDQVNWDNASLNDELSQDNEEQRTRTLTKDTENEDNIDYRNARQQVLQANSIDEINNALYGPDGDSVVADKFLDEPGHDAANFYRDSNQVDKYKSTVSDFLYKYAK